MKPKQFTPQSSLLVQNVFFQQHAFYNDDDIGHEQSQYHQIKNIKSNSNKHDGSQNKQKHQYQSYDKQKQNGQNIPNTQFDDQEFVILNQNRIDIKSRCRKYKNSNKLTKNVSININTNQNNNNNISNLSKFIVQSYLNDENLGQQSMQKQQLYSNQKQYNKQNHQQQSKEQKELKQQNIIVINDSDNGNITNKQKHELKQISQKMDSIIISNKNNKKRLCLHFDDDDLDSQDDDEQQQQQQLSDNNDDLNDKQYKGTAITSTNDGQNENNIKKKSNKNVLLVDFGDCNNSDSDNSDNQNNNNNNVVDINININKPSSSRNRKLTTQTKSINYNNKPNIFLSNFGDDDNDDESDENSSHNECNDVENNRNNILINTKNKNNNNKTIQQLNKVILSSRFSSSSSQEQSKQQQSQQNQPTITKPICISQLTNILATNDISIIYQPIPEHCVLQTIVKRYSSQQQIQKNNSTLYEMFDSTTYKSILRIKKSPEGYELLYSLPQSSNKLKQQQIIWRHNTKHITYTPSNKTKLKQQQGGVSCALVTSNFFGTQFNCYKFNRSNQKPQQIKLTKLLTINYQSNFLGLKGPRKMHVFIPNVDNLLHGQKGLDEIYQQQQQQQQKLTKQSEPNNRILNKKVIKFVNRTPKWNSEISSFVLNFHGRATVSSVKNFIITNSVQFQQKQSKRCQQNKKFIQKDLVLFGKIDKNIFNLDIKYPFNIVQGLVLALSSFDKKIGCQ